MDIRPSIVIPETSDPVAAKELTAFALLQRKILRAAMQFQSLDQDMRTVYMVDGSIITIKSCHNVDTITIECPKEIAPLPEDIPKIYIILVEGGRTSHTVYWYTVSGVLVHSETVALTHDYDIYDTLFDPDFVGPEGIVMMDFTFWQATFNSVVLRVFTDYPPHLGLDEWYDGAFYYRRLPIIPRINNARDWPGGMNLWQPDTRVTELWGTTAPTVEHNYEPKQTHMTKCGFKLHAMINYSIPGSYVQALGTSEFVGLPLYGEGEQIRVVQAWDTVPLADNHQPTNWEYESIICCCPSSYKDFIFMAIAIFDTSGFIGSPPAWSGGGAYGGRYVYEGIFKEAYIGWWAKEDVTDGIHTWRTDYVNETGGFLALGTTLVTLTKNQFYQLKQIECHNDKVYIFSDSGQGTRLVPGTDQVTGYSGWPDLTQNAKVDVYDFRVGHEGEFIKTQAWGESYLDRVSYIQAPVGLRVDASKRVFGVRLKPTATTWLYDMLFVDVDTLEVERTLKLPLLQAVVVEAPVNDYMTKKVNEVRAAQPAVNRVYNTRVMALPYVGLNTILSEAAVDHLQWCLAEHNFIHEDENGDAIEIWGRPYGIWYAADNLACMPATLQHDEIDIAMALWVASPPHFANLTTFEVINIGWASVVIPASYGSFGFTGTTINPTGMMKVYQLILAAG